MNETKLQDRLHELASKMPVDLDRSVTRTLRRARARRGAVAFVASAAVVAVVVGGTALLRVAAPEGSQGSEPVVPATDAPSPRGELIPPSPAPFLGLWPETTPETLAETQAQVDDGHQPLRLEPEQTAVMLATNLFGWSYRETESSVVANDPRVVVELRNRNVGEDIPPITVGVAQLGRTGPDGIWSVVSVTSPLFDPVQIDTATNEERASINFVGTLAETVPESVVRFEILRGPISEAGEIAGEVSVDGRDFSGSAGSWPSDTFEVGGTVLWLHVVDAAGRTFAAMAFPLAAADDMPPTPEPTAPPSPDLTDLPLDVVVTARRIYLAALAHDVDALAELIDPERFVYNFDDALDPIEIWRAEPTLLDAIPTIMTLQPTIVEVEAERPYYVWPYLMEAGALDEVGEQERADLHALGFSDEHIDEMQAFGGYLGPRLTIASDGTWLNYVTGGD